jgi:hypothetical protein
MEAREADDVGSGEEAEAPTSATMRTESSETSLTNSRKKQRAFDRTAVVEASNKRARVLRGPNKLREDTS